MQMYSHLIPSSLCRVENSQPLKQPAPVGVNGSPLPPKAGLLLAAPLSQPDLVHWLFSKEAVYIYSVIQPMLIEYYVLDSVLDTEDSVKQTKIFAFIELYILQGR